MSGDADGTDPREGSRSRRPGVSRTSAPTPIRDSLKKRKPDAPRNSSRPRTLEVAGDVWTVEAIGSGRTRSGGAPLLEVQLTGPERVLSSLIVATALDGVDDDLLLELIERSEAD